MAVSIYLLLHLKSAVLSVKKRKLRNIYENGKKSYSWKKPNARARNRRWRTVQIVPRFLRLDLYRFDRHMFDCVLRSCAVHHFTVSIDCGAVPSSLAVSQFLLHPSICYFCAESCRVAPIEWQFTRISTNRPPKLGMPCSTAQQVEFL